MITAAMKIKLGVVINRCYLEHVSHAADDLFVSQLQHIALFILFILILTRFLILKINTVVYFFTFFYFIILFSHGRCILINITLNMSE